MTKVQKHFRLQRPLDEALMEQIADAHSIYGIETIKIARSREDLLVEFDASRLQAEGRAFEVLAVDLEMFRESTLEHRQKG